MTRAWSRGRITGTSKGLQLLRYPRSKPICTTRPVSEHDQPHMRSPLIAAAPRSRFRRAGLRKTRTILESGISGHGLLRFVYLDPPGLIRSWEMTGLGWCSLGNLHRNAFDYDTGGHVFPERDQELSRQCHDGCLAQAAAVAANPFVKPDTEC